MPQGGQLYLRTVPDGPCLCVEFQDTGVGISPQDIRRAQPNWSPRPENAVRDDALWSGLKLTAMGRVLFRKSPVGVTLRAAGRKDIVAHKAPPGVLVVGLPSEITLIAFGRPTSLARIVVQGDADDVAAFEASQRGI